MKIKAIINYGYKQNKSIVLQLLIKIACVLFGAMQPKRELIGKMSNVYQKRKMSLYCISWWWVCALYNNSIIILGKNWQSKRNTQLKDHCNWIISRKSHLINQHFLLISYLTISKYSYLSPFIFLFAYYYYLIN